MKYANVFLLNNIQPIGGIETYLWELAKKYSAYDIVVAYKEADKKQLERLQSKIRCIKLNKPIECKKCFMAYNVDTELVKADEYIQVIHANYEIQKLKPNTSPNVSKYVGVSKWVSDAYKRLLQKEGIYKDIEVCYNPITIDKPKKVLRLITASRLSKEKGKDRMIQLAEKLIEKEIPFIWLVFTNDEIPTIPGFIKMPSNLDIRNYITDADYLVQLSDTEGYCYSVMEAWILNTMTITTPVPSFYEQGLIESLNGYVIDYDMNNLDKFVDLIYTGVHNFTWNAPKDKYDELLIKEPNTYNPKDFIKVKAIQTFYDTFRDTWVMKDTTILIDKKDKKEYIKLGAIPIK